MATSEYGTGKFGDKSGRDWVKQSEADPVKGSEYGGVGGLIQPRPHEVENSPSEQLMLIYNTDPGVETSGLDLPKTKKIRDYNQ